MMDAPRRSRSAFTSAPDAFNKLSRRDDPPRRGVDTGGSVTGVAVALTLLSDVSTLLTAPPRDTSAV
jgi:hypothetical protein